MNTIQTTDGTINSELISRTGETPASRPASCPDLCPARAPTSRRPGRRPLSGLDPAPMRLQANGVALEAPGAAQTAETVGYQLQHRPYGTAVHLLVSGAAPQLARRSELGVVSNEHAGIVDIKIGKELSWHRVHHGLLRNGWAPRCCGYWGAGPQREGDHRRRGYVPRATRTKTGQ